MESKKGEKEGGEREMNERVIRQRECRGEGTWVKMNVPVFGDMQTCVALNA